MDEEEFERSYNIKVNDDCVEETYVDMGDELYRTIENMKKYGGSFVKALAKCFESADLNNTRKLKETFKEYCDKYKKI